MVEFEIALKSLSRENVDFVIIGELAISAYSPGYITTDLDFCYSRTKENLSKIISSLAPFNPRFRGFPTDLPFVWDERTLQNGTNFTLETTIGEIDMLGEQKAVEGEAALSLVQFDDQYETVYSDKDINSAAELTEATFQPRGMTALYDAVGRTINAVGQKLANLPENERPDQVIFVILTDGFENASREFSAIKLSEMICHQRKKYNWEFIFIGANQDAILSAREIGINADAALTYAANEKGTRAAFSSVAKNVARYRVSKLSAELNFSDDDRKLQEDALKSDE